MAGTASTTYLPHSAVPASHSSSFLGRVSGHRAKSRTCRHSLIPAYRESLLRDPDHAATQAVAAAAFGRWLTGGTCRFLRFCNHP